MLTAATPHIRRIERAARHHHRQAVRSFHSTHRHAKRLMKKHKIVIHKVRDHSVKTAAVASISAGMLAVPVASSVQPGAAAAAAPHEVKASNEIVFQQTEKVTSDFAIAEPEQPAVTPSVDSAKIQANFIARLKEIAPGHGNTFTADQESQISNLIKQSFNISATAELDGYRLNANRGLIGGEQHLPLYPGDTIVNHEKDMFTGKPSDVTARLTKMVPGKPSYGYWANSRAEVTPKMVEQERWYFVAQNFDTPQFDANPNKAYLWYKYRKFIVISENRAVVMAFADAGPGLRTGKKFGASNESMDALGFGRSRKGEVTVMYINDPEDKIPLGPVNGYLNL